MKKKIFAMACLSAALLTFAGCSSTSNTTQGGAQGAAEIETITTTATVQSIDAANRKIVLQGADGSVATYKLGPQVINFDQIHVGDVVTASLSSEVAIYVGKDRAPASFADTRAIIAAPKGAKPGVVVASTVNVTAKVVAIDDRQRLLTLQMPDGQMKTEKASRHVNLAEVKPGDDVVVQIAEAMMIMVQGTGSTATQLTAAEATELGTEAYIYGYPLVTMEYTRRVTTNVREPEGLRAPMNQFARARTYPNAAFRDVTAPNADTLYSSAWLDVSQEPYILSLPEAHDRYYLFPMLDGWTDVFQVPGKRTTGTGPQKYAITGPGWSGTLPDGVVEYKSPTSLVWILGRIYCTGTPEDYDAVHKMQDEITVVPLSSYGQPYTTHEGSVDPNIEMKIPVRDQVNALSAQDYFSLLAKLMKDNPPTTEDAPMVAKLARLGIVPGTAFDINKLGPDASTALQSVPKAAFGKIMSWFKESIAAGDNKLINGWVFTTQTGLYGTNYLQRALVTAIGLGANRPQDAIYPTSETNADGKPYSGANKYVMHFNKGELPPVDGFWSLTMYDGNYFFVENPLNRYSISARQDLKANDDGSVDLYLQHDSPGPDKESNWLPAPADKFVLMLRLYWPKETPPSIIDGSWVIPAAKPAM